MNPSSNVPGPSTSRVQDDEDNADNADNADDNADDNASEEDYEVEEILLDKTIDGEKYYLVKWVGFSEEENTWEPRESFTSSARLLEEYELRKREEREEMAKIQHRKMISKMNEIFAKKRSSSRERSGTPSSRRRTPQIDSSPEPPRSRRRRLSVEHSTESIHFDEERPSTSKESSQQRSTSTSSIDATSRKKATQKPNDFLKGVLEQMLNPRQVESQDPNDLQIFATKMYFQQRKRKLIQTSELLPNEELPSECGFMRDFEAHQQSRFS
ncbi:unnamed protein product, partial [Mesorhabditis belari]|uniref:Chromo domain-containing protein n=1 Tax=Mesorhabditis belari TaxID=2138241 RepID=A0AAF3J3F3_9BILA